MHDAATEMLLDAITDEVEAMGNFHGHPRHSRQVEQRGRDMPQGTPGRAQWLIVAGESWHAGGDLDRAQRCYRDALDDGGATWVDVRAPLAGVLFDAGDQQAADGLLQDLRADARRGLAVGPVHEFAGDVCEERGRLRDALRWYDSALSRAALSDSQPDQGCLNGHYRVRRALGLPHDVWDELALERREAPDV